LLFLEKLWELHPELIAMKDFYIINLTVAKNILSRKASKSKTTGTFVVCLNKRRTSSLYGEIEGYHTHNFQLKEMTYSRGNRQVHSDFEIRVNQTSAQILAFLGSRHHIARRS
jgi:hypothetical protein